VFTIVFYIVFNIILQYSWMLYYNTTQILNYLCTLYYY